MVSHQEESRLMSNALSDALKDALSFTPEAFKSLGVHIEAGWFIESLAAHPDPKATATMRRRRLPLDVALWLVIGMALFRDRSIHEVAEHLGLSLGGATGGALSPGALPQARARLGLEPVEHLFALTAEHWGRRAAEADRWRGLSLFGIDGSCMRVPDTIANDSTFKRPGSAREGSGYPQVRLTCLMALRSHVLAGMNVGAYDESEQSLTKALWSQIPDHSLTAMDRGFVSWKPLHDLCTTGVERHFLVRSKAKLRWTEVRRLGPGDFLVDIAVHKALRKAHPEMPESFRARIIDYQVKGYRPQQLITSLLDPEVYPAVELAGIYHERWEIELGYDEIKTHMLDREEALRSKTPDGVLQEIAGIGIAYNLVRVEMARVASELGVEPTRLSFLHSLHLIQNFCLAAWATSAPGNIPRRLGSLHRDIGLLVLPPRRSERVFKRHVKIKMSNYPRNRTQPGRAAK
jgi:hypothetical protein